ncbi:MAG: AAA family ATPase [Rhodobacteraceae bacterium]|nr:AAA family ATPase [Paracoccaceae bacterium]
MLFAANEAWTQQGYRVRGAALSGKAADGLQESSGIKSRTLASLELSWKNGFSLLEPNDVLVIDEAGMIGTRQLQRFVEETDSRGAKLVLVGDPEQLQPINAGTPFREIKENIDHVELTEIRRQKDAWQRQASLDFAQDRTDAALKAYADHGAVETSANTSEAIAKLVQDYMIDLEIRGSECSRLALAYRRKDVHAINQGIRMARKSGGELSDETFFKTKHGPRAFAAGDRILFTMNDHQLGVRNGLQGVVENVTESKITVRFDSDGNTKLRRLTFSPKRYNAIDHGYATTIHKSQGATVDHAFVLGSRQMDRHLTYVAMSRHRDSVKLYEDRSCSIKLGNEMKRRPTRRWNVRRSLE